LDFKSTIISIKIESTTFSINVNYFFTLLSELDLRIGASFTRLQTLYLRQKFPRMANELVSYGSCQFPTLGFIVERWRAIHDFQSEPFWKIEVHHRRDDVNTVFIWDRGRIFSENAAKAFYDDVMEGGPAKVS
jgi:DNA topoisomerase-3